MNLNFFTRKKSVWLCLIVFMIGIAVTLTAFQYSKLQLSKISEALFQRAADDIFKKVSFRLEIYVNSLYGAKGLFSTNDTVDAQDWQAYIQKAELFRRYPGIMRARFIQYFKSDQKIDIGPRIEAQIKTLLGSGFDVKVHPEGEREEYFIATYIEPLKGNEDVLGFDLGTETQRREALLAARDSGEPKITKKIILSGSAASRSPAFLITMPIYREAMPVATAEERRAAIRGFVDASFLAENLFREIFGKYRTYPDIQVKIFDEKEISETNLIYEAQSLAEREGTPNELPLSTLRYLEVAGQTWALEFKAPLSYGLSPVAIATPFIIVGAGTLLSLFLSVAFYFLLTAKNRAEDIAKSMTLDLRAARDDALRASEAKSEFLATMSHEIRTPLNSILGMADLLAETKLSEEQTYFSKTLQRSTDALLNLVNDILDLSKIEASQLELEEIHFNLRDLLERTFELMALKAHQKGLEIGFHIKEDTPLDWRGDPNRLRQVIVNLLGNAIKFTTQGRIFLEVVLEDPKNAAGRPAQLLFTISDTGVGIPKDKLDLIFEPFRQVDSSTTRKFGGTGLGLNISKRLVGAMGGRIWAESEEGKGTKFLFTVSLKPSEVPGESHRIAESSGKNILIVDSDSMSCYVLKGLLRELGFGADEANTSDDCFSKISAKQYDYIFINCRMPKMDGFQIADGIRTETSENPPRLMLLLPQNFRKDDISKAREHGFKRVLTKPVKLGELKSALHIMEGLGKGGFEESSAAEVKAKEFHEKAIKILLADDSEDNLTLMQFYLKSTPHEVQTASNGEEALEKFKAGNFELVFMDMHMPVMDGYESTRRIRAWEKKSQAKDQPLKNPTTIIALTADAIKTNVQKGLDAGCNAHLTKPIRKEVLIGLISEYMK